MTSTMNISVIICFILSYWTALQSIVVHVEVQLNKILIRGQFKEQEREIVLKTAELTTITRKFNNETIISFGKQFIVYYAIP